uniref:Uncharacterized protein n=1 Tax=Glossina morsitans morsitans TaxID=37546 RepID=A0A1B0GGJ3_GLOMM
MSTVLTLDLYKEIYYLTQEETKNWRQVLKYGEGLELNSKRKLLWTWPTEKYLQNLKYLLGELDIKDILSIGCGSGLLEWLLTESLDIFVYGLEIDRNWWQSQYAMKSFIKLNYADDILIVPTRLEDAQKFLQNCCNLHNWNFALLFCYFNNRQAFLYYVSVYRGKWIILIGPSEDANVHSDPMPLQPEFEIESAKQWQLRESLHLNECDILALYERL